MEIDNELNKILDNGKKYFNSLNFKRTSLTFIEDENGDVKRLGKKGFFAIPNIDGLQSCEIKKSNNDEDWLCVGETVETPFYSISFNSDGSIKYLFDKQRNRQWLKGNFNKLRVFYDYPGTYDAWDILPNYRDKEEELVIDSPLKLTFKNNETAEFTTVLKTGKSQWKMIIRVFRQSEAIEVENIVDWNEKHRLAKVDFCPDILTRELVCDTSAGFIKRDMTKNTTWQQARFEVCHHKWFDISETDGGISVINNGKYGVGISEDAVSLSLLRSTIRPDPTSDMGHHEFSYLILPHSGDAVSANINNIAFEYNVPLRKSDINFDMNFGELYLEAMKLSENGECIIFRLSEQNGKRGTLELNDEYILTDMTEKEEKIIKSYNYKPFEIITLAKKLTMFTK